MSAPSTGGPAARFDTAQLDRSTTGVARVIVLSLVVGALLTPITARAQCAEGRARSAATAGRCCWPGQRFSTERGRCEGAPSCPSPLVAHGDACIAPELDDEEWEDEEHDEADAVAPTASPPSDQPPVEPDRVELPRPPGSSRTSRRPGARRRATPWGAPLGASVAPELLWPASPSRIGAVADPRLVHGVDDGLVIAGLAVFGAGYLVAILGGAIDQSARNCGTFSGFGFTSMGCDSWPAGFVPIAGGVLAGTLHFSGQRQSTGIGVILGPIVAIMQIFGIGVLSHAAAFPTEDVVPAATAPAPAARISIAPHGSPDGAGLSVEVEL
jgi:hypothetical protein